MSAIGLSADTSGCFRRESAGSHAVRRFPIALVSEAVGAVLVRLRSESFDAVDPILVTDQEGDIVLMNEPAERLFNVPASAGEGPQRRVRANGANLTSFVSNVLTRTGEQRYRGEIQLSDPQTGRSLPVEAAAGTILSEQGELVWVVTILHDRTEAIEKAQGPLRKFMFRQVHDEDLALFVKLADMKRPDTRADVPTHVLIPAFLISELKTAFQIGFFVFIPFLIIDMVVASTLMSMGMIMLPPVMISLPFKILLFVLIDGWALTIESLVLGFGPAG